MEGNRYYLPGASDFSALDYCPGAACGGLRWTNHGGFWYCPGGGDLYDCFPGLRNRQPDLGNFKALYGSAQRGVIHICGHYAFGSRAFGLSAVYRGIWKADSVGIPSRGKFVSMAQ